MKAFKYNLETALKVRRLEQERREVLLAQARTAKAAADLALAECQRQRQECCETAARKRGPVAPIYYLQLEAFLQAQRREEANRVTKVKAALEQVDRCLHDLQTVTREVRRLEKHRVHKEHLWQAAIHVEELKLNDEIGTVLACRQARLAPAEYLKDERHPVARAS